MKKDLSVLLGSFGRDGKPGCGGLGKLRMAGAVLCLGLYIILCGIGSSGFVSPAMAGENGTLLWWGNGDGSWGYVDDVRQRAAKAEMDFAVYENGESLSSFLGKLNFDKLDSPVVLYWIPGHGSGWANVGDYTPTEIVAMVEEAKSAIGINKIDTLILGPCYAGNIETMSCFAGLAKKVFGSPATATVNMVRLWLSWILYDREEAETAEYENYLRYKVSRFESGIDAGEYGSLVDPEKALEFLQALREKDIPVSVFQNLKKGKYYFGGELGDVWSLAETYDLGNKLLSFTTLWNAPNGPQWKAFEECCYLGVWNGEDEDLYIATVPEANRCIPGSSVTPDEPTPVPAGAASGGGGGCMVGAHNFPALLLLIPLTVVMMKKGKK